MKPLMSIKYGIISYQQKAVTFNLIVRLVVDHLYATWTNEETIYTCQFIFSCVGITNYIKGYQPEFKDQNLSMDQ
jgi:hypothetical protein